MDASLVPYLLPVKHVALCHLDITHSWYSLNENVGSSGAVSQGLAILWSQVGSVEGFLLYLLSQLAGLEGQGL